MGTVYMVTEKGLRTVKVGYTKNWAQRRKAYRTHSTCARIIDVMDGSRDDEKMYQQKMLEMGFTKAFKYSPKNEWFRLPKDMKKSELEHLGFGIFQKDEEDEEEVDEEPTYDPDMGFDPYMGCYTEDC